MKNLMFLLLGLIFILSSCNKDPDPDPNPNPTPTVYRAVVQLNFSDLPQGIDGFGTFRCCLYQPGTDLAILWFIEPELITPPQYNWELDTAFVRQYKGKEIGLYYVGCMDKNNNCIPLERRFIFTLKTRPDINSFFIDIVLPDEGAPKIDDEEKADKFR